MGIIPCEIPLLEFDPEQTAVIGPDYEQLDLHLPRKCVFAFLGGYIDRYAHAAGARQVATFNSATRLYPIYVTTYHGQEVALCQAPVGAAAAAQLLDWLISYGVREIISTGSCGVLTPFDEGTFLVPCKALRDEGDLLPLRPALPLYGDQRTRPAGHRANYPRPPYALSGGRHMDGFFRETKEKVAYRKSEGCSVVEMECSALAACAAFRSATWGMLLYTADSLADVQRYDQRHWGGSAYEYALTLCLDAVLAL